MDNPYTYTLCQSKMIYVINRVINHDKLQSNLRAKQVKCHINTPCPIIFQLSVCLLHMWITQKRKRKEEKEMNLHIQEKKGKKKKINHPQTYIHSNEKLGDNSAAFVPESLTNRRSKLNF